MVKHIEDQKPVGVWIRVSTQEQASGESPENHLQRATYYCQAKDWTVVTVYDLSGVSGKSVLEHPEAKRMLEDVKTGQVTGLVFSKLARLARNTKELLDIADYFQEHDAELISLGESIDTSTPAGRLFFTVISALGQFEREEISSRIRDSVPIRAQRGLPLGGAAPFGYQWQDKQLVIDPHEAPIRKHLFELFAEHRRKKTVARLLNEAGYRTRKGAKFTDTTVARLLRDPVAKGQRRANYTTKDGDNWITKPESEWVFTEVEPIVPEELWEKCNDILEAQTSRRTPVARRPVHLFSGIVECGCGTKMYPRTQTNKYICEGCRTKIPVEDLDAVYHEQLRGFLFSDTEIVSHLETAEDASVERRALLDSLKNELKTVEQDMEQMLKMYMAGDIAQETFRTQFRPLEEQKTALHDEIPRIEADVDFLTIQTLSSDQLISDARDLYSKWPTLDRREQRRIVESITDRIIVDDDSVTIDLCHLPSLETATSGQRTVKGSLPL